MAIRRGMFIDPGGRDCDAPHLACRIVAIDTEIFECCAVASGADDPEPTMPVIELNASL